MPATKTVSRKKEASKVFSAAERDAMVSRAKEVKSERAGADADGEREVLEKIKTMLPADRALAQRFHAIVKSTVPNLTPRTYYGMPAYARDGKVVFWFKDAGKFKTRYATIGFSDAARLDDGEMWPTEYSVLRLTPAVEAKIGVLIKRAAG
jgi:uncharacterized protein YdhG (YjbR/CyaY superfamily)